MIARSSLAPQLSAAILLARSAVHHALHSFPTRRSSDLRARAAATETTRSLKECVGLWASFLTHTSRRPRRSDRKSTRLNSSHMSISYAVFCLYKKKTDDLQRVTGNVTSMTDRSSLALQL